jgi:hypothetical protein
LAIAEAEPGMEAGMDLLPAFEELAGASRSIPAFLASRGKPMLTTKKPILKKFRIIVFCKSLFTSNMHVGTIVKILKGVRRLPTKMLSEKESPAQVCFWGTG